MAMFRRIANLFRRTRIDGEIAAELQAHLEMRIDDNVASGMNREEARHDALLRFGNPAVLKERTFAADAALALGSVWFDLRYALRQLRKAPIFAVTTILTLALGIGATTAIFSAMNAVLLRLLPVANPGELYYLHVPGGQPRGARNTGDSETSFSLPAFEALRHDRRAFSGVAAFAPLNIDKVVIRFGEDAPELVSGEMVSGNFFSLLGVSARVGRLLGMADESQHAPVAVLNYAYWTRRFSRNPAVLGQTVSIKGVPFTVVGIAAQGFPGSEPGEFTDVWIPLQRRPELNPWGNTEDKTVYGLPNWWCLRLIARLAPGVSAAQAVAESTPSFQAAAYASLGTPDPSFPKVTMEAVPAKGIQGMGDYYREPITILMVLVTLVLVIACSNVAMLLVARNAARRRDFSLRMALGAGRTALLRQLLVESALLVVSGAVSGWLFALYATRALAAWSHLATGLAPDSFVLVFTGIVSVLAALLFGVAPMRSATGGPVAGALRATVSTRHQGVRGGNAVLAVQVALCFTLLAAAGLMVRTLLNFERTDLGMRTDQLLVFGVTPQGTTTNPQRFAFYRTLLDRMRALPGVESATFVENRPGAGWSNNDEPIVDGVSYSFDRVPLRTNTVGPDFLQTMGIPLLAGRDLRDSDTPSSPRVALVNETFVKKLLPKTNPLGHQLGDFKKHPYTIVGVAADSKYRSVDEAPRAMAYYPYTQTEDAPSTIQVELRTSGDPLVILPSAERALHQINPNLPLETPMTQAAVFEDSYAQPRLFSRLAMFFALLAALLVAIGLYGTLSYRISRRNAEIGVRMALGARRSQVLYSILRESFRIAAIGIVAGIPLALISGHFMSSMLYKLQPYDLASLLGALGGIVAISLAAGFIPARRAASIDPARALRSE
jgi:predicted permease